MKTVRGVHSFWAFAAAVSLACLAVSCRNEPGPAASAANELSSRFKIGNYHMEAPYGIAMIVDDQTAFLIDPEWDEEGGKTPYWEKDRALVPPATAAPDFSYFRAILRHAGANIRFTWGRSGESAVAAILETDRPVRLTFRLAGGWPRFHNAFSATDDGVTGYGITPAGDYIPFLLRCDPVPSAVEANMAAEGRMILALDPGRAARFAAGVGQLPELKDVESLLTAAGERYAARRVQAEGDWGDFLGAIADNLNNSRAYGSDNGRIAHVCGRGWWIYRGSPDHYPYFLWDSFFHGALSCLEDPASARDTVRAVLSFVTPAGFVPSYSHWEYEKDYVTMDRSMPPVGAMCLWKMHQRWPDAAFLAEVYPKLVRWHDWWPASRDGNANGLLEWGSEKKFWQGAQWETGWDDNVHFEGAEMAGTTMNADAVDLSSLWSADAEYLAMIAAALGREDDAERFERQHAEMNRRINERLWNEDLGVYASRLWEVPASEGPALDPKTVFENGFEATFYRDRDLGEEAFRRRDTQIDFDWGESAAAKNLPADHWSARWKGVLRVPQTGLYRIRTRADDGLRLWIDGKAVIDDWRIHWEEPRHAELELEAGKAYPVVIEYFDLERMASLRFSLHALSAGRPGSDWLTRVTPMNFYPLICGAPDAGRAGRVLAWIFRPEKFWGRWIIPTVAYDDPVWGKQEYWRGHIWPSANYLIWQGLRRYADSGHKAEFARRSVDLFMRNWLANRQCGENYKSTDGTCGDHPHYTWGALLCLIGLEALIDAGPDFQPQVSQGTGFSENITLRRVPFGGRLYRIDIRDGRASAKLEN